MVPSKFTVADRHHMTPQDKQAKATQGFVSTCTGTVCVTYIGVVEHNFVQVLAAKSFKMILPRFRYVFRCVRLWRCRGRQAMSEGVRE